MGDFILILCIIAKVEKSYTEEAFRPANCITTYDTRLGITLFMYDSSVQYKVTSML